MPHAKIATCCYCGTRAALVLRGDTRHELSCAACGAPLHDLKAIRAEDSRATGRASGHGHAGPRANGMPARGAPAEPTAKPRKPKARPKKKKSRRKPLGRRLLGEAFDLLDDIFD